MTGWIMDDIWLILEKDMTSQIKLMARASSLVIETAKSLGSKAICVVLGSNLSSDECYRFANKEGYDSVLLIDNPYLTNYCADHYIFTLLQLLRDYHPSVIIFPSHPHFQEVAAQVAEQLQAPCALNYDNIRISKDRGIILEKVITRRQEQISVAVDSTSHPVVIVLGKDIGGPNYSVISKVPLVKSLAVELNGYLVHSRFVGVEKMDIESIDLSEAEIIVAGGGGVNTPEGWSLIQVLAGELGAKIAGSRAAFMRNFITENQIVGISGKVVSPRLYIAIGISGCNEHLIGMRTSESIICVNKEKSAPIFRYAQLGIVADLYFFLPRLIKSLQELKDNSNRDRKDNAKDIH